MTPMLLPQNCIFTNSLICLVIPIRDLNTKKEKQEQVCKFDRKPWYHVRILIYQTIEIDHMTLLEYRNIIMLFLVLILRHKLKIKGTIPSSVCPDKNLSAPVGNTDRGISPDHRFLIQLFLC